MSGNVWILDKAYEDGEMGALKKALEELRVHVERVEWDAIHPRVVNARFVGSELLRDLPDVALVNARVFTKHQQGDMALLYDWLEFFERRGVRLVNSAQSLRQTHNKVLQADILSEANVPVPPTRMVESSDDVQHCIEECRSAAGVRLGRAGAGRPRGVPGAVPRAGRS
jgi:tetrahydromethanopterin:alpha-L-glutamate ligase